MNWFYAVDGQKHGPISDAELDQLLASEKIRPDTLVWCEGMANWQPVSVARSAAATPVPGQATGRTCVECGRNFPPSELIQIRDASVCAACKPVFLQRLSEGAALPSANTGLWRSGNKIVTVTETIFPERCIKCNQPTHGFLMKRVLYWQHPAYYFFILCNLLVLVIVLLIVRKKAIVQVGLCESHRAARKQNIIISWAIFAGSVGLFVAAAMYSNGLLVLLGVVAFFTSIIHGVVKCRVVVAAKITKENVWIKGAKKEFLDTLPEWPGI